jgi:hypothetical protein
LAGFKGRHYDDAESNDDDWIFDPDLVEMNRALERELRAEAQEDEFATAEAELRGRTIEDITRELRNSADVVSLYATQRTFTGTVVTSGRDFVTLTSPELEADINLADITLIRLVKRTRQGGAPAPAGPGSFAMQLQNQAAPNRQVEIGFINRPRSIRGFIRTVGQDHIVFKETTGEEAIINIAHVAFVVRRSSASWR